MNPPDSAIDPTDDESGNDDDLGVDDSILARWAADLADRLRAGEVPDLEEYTREHPERAEQLRRLLPAIAMMAQLGTASDQVVTPGFDLEVGQGVLGEFRLLREVGRGGMGVVYEALEVPLGRRVALKVLPFATALDPRQLKRFQLEAQAVASLNHRNIVPIFSVGRDRGVSYFAMQLIDGRTLADVNRELRQFVKRGTLEETLVVSDVTRSLLERPLSPGLGEDVASASPALQADVAPPRSDRGSSPPAFPSTRGRAFFRTAADLGRQAAEALAHVHDLGIQHRDIKPANLLVDTEGHLWVTDFGLARLQGDGEQTRTGDVVGTLRYMSPEQALARPGMIDHRTDIYSLGATLYELLTLRPAFGGDDRQDLLLRIVQEEPVPPRRLDPTIPIDLETIVTKTMAKEPGRRYATAQELAEDLTRFLERRPVLARRPSPVDRVTKWVRRRWPLVATAAALILLFAGISIVGLSWSNSRLRTAIASAEQYQRQVNRHLFATQIRLAEQALEQGQIERTQDILEEIKPRADGTDARHFAWHYLRRLAMREIVLLRGHEDRVDSMALSPDGRSLVTVDATKKTRLWDADSGRLRATLAGEYSWQVPREPKFSPDSRYLLTTEAEANATASDPERMNLDPAMVIWDAITGRRLSRTAFNHRAGHLRGAEFVLGGEAIATQWAEPDTTITTSIWGLGPDLSRPQLRVEVRGFQDVRFAQGGRNYSTRQQDRYQLRDVTTGRIRHVLPSDDVPGLNWGFSPDGHIGVLSGRGHGVSIWNTDSGVEVSRDKSRILRWPFSFSSNGQTLVSGDEFGSGLVYLWDRTTGRWDTLRPDRSERPQLFDCALSSDGTKLALACTDGGGGERPVTVWDVRTLRLVKTCPGRLGRYRQPSFAADRRSVFLAGSSEICRWYFDSAGRETPRSLAGHADEAWTVAFSPNGRVLASGSNDTDEPQTIKLWETADGKLIRGWKAHPGTVSDLKFSPDGRSLASVALCEKENARIWDPVTGRLLSELIGHTKAVRTVSFSPNGTLLATAGSDYAIRLWNPSTGRLHGVLSGHSDSVHKVAFSPDGRSLASTGNDCTIRLWDVATGVQRHIITGPTYFKTLAFSPDGSLLVTADGAGRLSLYESASGTSRAWINCDDDELRALTFSPDGALIAAAGVSRTIHLWDVATRQELLTLAGHRQQINDLAFTPDGMTLASCSHDGAIKIWEAVPRIVNHHTNGDGRRQTDRAATVDPEAPPTCFQE